MVQEFWDTVYYFLKILNIDVLYNRVILYFRSIKDKWNTYAMVQNKIIHDSFQMDFTSNIH